MSDPTHPEKEAPAPPDAAGSDEPVAPNAFAKALEDFERGKPPAEAQQRRIAAGMKLRGTLVSISDDQSLLDIGGRSEGVIETRHLTTDQAEERVERQAREFELLKPYLVERWGAPEAAAGRATATASPGSRAATATEATATEAPAPPPPTGATAAT